MIALENDERIRFASVSSVVSACGSCEIGDEVVGEFGSEIDIEFALGIEPDLRRAIKTTPRPKTTTSAVRANKTVGMVSRDSNGAKISSANIKHFMLTVL